MSKHNKRVTISDRLARRANQQIDPKRLDLLEKILEEASSVPLNDITKQQSARQVLESHSKLLELIDELRQLELQWNPKLPSRDKQQSWNTFFQWVDSKQNADNKLSHKLDVVEQVSSQEQEKNADSNNSSTSTTTTTTTSTSQEYALVAKVPFEEGENIFSISRQSMLSTETAFKDHDLAEFIKKDSIASAMQNVVLALHLLNEHSKGEKSEWHSYISILPDKSLPILVLNKDKLNCLIASAHLYEALKMIRAIARQYSYFFKRLQSTQLPLSKNFTFEYYCWGVSMVCSRQNEIPPKNRNTAIVPVVHALIPILDMCNHHWKSNQAIFENDESRLVASKRLEVNEEIVINYGTRSSGDFYIHNGFVPKEVKFDIVPLIIALDKENPLFQAKSQLLKTLNMPNQGRFKLTHDDLENRHKRDPHLTMFLIVYLMSKEELEFVTKSDNPVGIADEIYEYVQYNQATLESCKGDDEEFSLKLKEMKKRLATCVKDYLSKRASIGLALIDRAIKENGELVDQTMLILLKHEKSIYESHLINSNIN